jgi:hypothetical protein
MLAGFNWRLLSELEGLKKANQPPQYQQISRIKRTFQKLPPVDDTGCDLERHDVALQDKVSGLHTRSKYSPSKQGL